MPVADGLYLILGKLNRWPVRKCLCRGNEELVPVAIVKGLAQAAHRQYVALRDGGFAGYRLTVTGLVEQEKSYSLAELMNMPNRTQITRHDCVEGWSCIAKWTGVPLSRLLDEAKVKPQARFVVYHCYDKMGGGLSAPEAYYESCDLIDAFHPQTILAWQMNGQPLPVAHGAPLRLRVERQLGYKQAKYIMRIELVESFAAIAGGKGGYWEDQGYEWYAGI